MGMLSLKHAGLELLFCPQNEGTHCPRGWESDITIPQDISLSFCYLSRDLTSLSLLQVLICMLPKLLHLVLISSVFLLCCGSDPDWAMPILNKKSLMILYSPQVKSKFHRLSVSLAFISPGLSPFPYSSSSFFFLIVKAHHLLHIFLIRTHVVFLLLWSCSSLFGIHFPPISLSLAKFLILRVSLKLHLLCDVSLTSFCYLPRIEYTFPFYVSLTNCSWLYQGITGDCLFTHLLVHLHNQKYKYGHDISILKCCRR